MSSQGPVCPHPGCEAPQRRRSNFCPRCGRPINIDPGRAGKSSEWSTFGWLTVAALACLFCLPCFFSSFGQPMGFVFLAPPVFFFWQAFKKPPPGIPR